MKNWNSFADFFAYLNNMGVDYVILRNYELLNQEKLIENHADIDILCDNFQKLVDATEAEQLDDRGVKCMVKISGHKIPMDVRSVGDGYYDKNWQRDMLKNKVLYKGLCWVLCKEDYFYSLAYHVMIQKYHISYDYQRDLVLFAKNMEIDTYRAGELREYLYLFMKKKGYYITCATNMSVLNLKSAPMALLRVNPIRYGELKLRQWLSYLE
jgi:hypothetical protein